MNNKKGFPLLLTAIGLMVGIKALTGISWWWVLSPLAAVIGFFIGYIFFIAFVFVVCWLIAKQK
jgi:hypothetical protein